MLSYASGPALQLTLAMLKTSKGIRFAGLASTVCGLAVLLVASPRSNGNTYDGVQLDEESY